MWRRPHTETIDAVPVDAVPIDAQPEVEDQRRNAEMDETQTMRASDRDRQQVVDRLRGAVEDGRLTMDEYLQRMELAYQAVICQDLAPLLADLPATGSVQGHEPDAMRPVASPAMAARAIRRPCLLGFVAGLPGVLRVAWATWLTAVAINVVVWALVSGTIGNLIYPWPLWVAGPYGAALLAISAVVASTRAQQRLGR
jgi:hypothetical protein